MKEKDKKNKEEKKELKNSINKMQCNVFTVLFN